MRDRVVTNYIRRLSIQNKKKWSQDRAMGDRTNQKWMRGFYFIYDWWSLSSADSLHLHVVLHEWLAFYSFLGFLNIYQSGVLTVLAWLVPHETAAISVQVLWTPYNHAPCHFMQSHTCKVYACLAVTCHLRFWQDDLDLLCAAVVTRGVKRIQK